MQYCLIYLYLSFQHSCDHLVAHMQLDIFITQDRLWRWILGGEAAQQQLTQAHTHFDPTDCLVLSFVHLTFMRGVFGKH